MLNFLGFQLILEAFDGRCADIDLTFIGQDQRSENFRDSVHCTGSNEDEIFLNIPSLVQDRPTRILSHVLRGKVRPKIPLNLRTGRFRTFIGTSSASIFQTQQP